MSIVAASIRPGQRRSHSWKKLLGKPGLDHQQATERPARAPLSRTPWESRSGPGSWAAPRRQGAYAHACQGALQLSRQSPLKQGPRGRERNATGITSCVQFRLTLTRLLGRPSCLRCGPLGLALCGGPLWVQASPPSCASVAAQIPGGNKGGCCYPIF